MGKTVVFDGAKVSVEAFSLDVYNSFPPVRKLYCIASWRVVCDEGQISYRGT